MSFIIDSLRRHASAQTIAPTPLGDIRLVRTPVGLAGMWFEGQKHHPGELPAPHVEDDPLLREAAARLSRYFDGGTEAFDLPLDLHGTPFQRAVWQALIAIGHGRKRTYGDIARSIGSPTAVRAVGAAVGRNPVSIIVPCHRVLGGDGSLTGYAGGVERKRALLRLEGIAC